MMALTSQERKVLLFLCFLFALGLIVTYYSKTAGCSVCLVDVYGPSQDHGFIDINRASAAELESLPGIGKKTADAIVRLRSLKRRFWDIEDLKAVKGIGDKKIAELRQYLVVP